MTNGAHHATWSAALVCVVVCALVVLAGGGCRSGSAPAREVGSTTACRRSPVFAAQAGYGSGAALSTHERQAIGLAVVDASGARPPYQHPTWDDAGTLGPFVTDRRGDVYALPSPRVNVQDNPAGALGTVMRVDGLSGEMSEFVRLPDADAAGDGNPYAGIGLAYDCDVDSLFVSSVAGSSRTDEVGHLYQVRVADGSIEETLVAVDAFGLATFNGAGGKRLYYALARVPEVWSVPLDGGPGEPRFEVSLPGSYVGRKLLFDAAAGTQQMHVVTMPFAFDLRAGSEREERVLSFAYDPASDSFTAIEAPPQ